MNDIDDGSAPARAGRRPSTSHAELSHIAIRLFVERGFDETTVDDIAAEAGIGRRTFFRYFPSKNDLPWGDFDGLLRQMRDFLGRTPDDVPLMSAIGQAVLRFNELPPEEVPNHRRRMRLLLEVPTLLAHSTLRYAAWREVVSEFVARRRGLAVDDLVPRAAGWAVLGVCLAAYEKWLRDDDADLGTLLEEAVGLLGDLGTA